MSEISKKLAETALRVKLGTAKREIELIAVEDGPEEALKALQEVVKAAAELVEAHTCTFKYGEKQEELDMCECDPCVCLRECAETIREALK